MYRKPCWRNTKQNIVNPVEVYMFIMDVKSKQIIVIIKVNRCSSQSNVTISSGRKLFKTNSMLKSYIRLEDNDFGIKLRTCICRRQLYIFFQVSLLYVSTNSERWSTSNQLHKNLRSLHFSIISTLIFYVSIFIVQTVWADRLYSLFLLHLFHVCASPPPPCCVLRLCCSIKLPTKFSARFGFIDYPVIIVVLLLRVFKWAPWLIFLPFCSNGDWTQGFWLQCGRALMKLGSFQNVVITISGL